MQLDPFYEYRFKEEYKELLRYWTRFSDTPDFAGKKVLDFGCGLGVQCIEAGKHDAESITGIDIVESKLEYARTKVGLEFPQIADRFKFFYTEIDDLQEDGFDLIISKDVFEHVVATQGDQSIERVGQVLEELKKRLLSGGILYLGWGPLWHSPLGDHRLSKELLPFGDFPIPWGHLFVTESFLIKRVNKRRGENYTDIYNYGLNKIPYKAFRKVVDDCGMEILSFEVNVTTNPLKPLFSLLRTLPFMEKYCTSTVYCVLRKKD